MGRKSSDIATLNLVGKNLKKLRSELGIPISDFAYQIGLSFGFYQRLEGGMSGTNYSNLQRASRRLGTTVDYLLGNSIEESLEDRRRKLEQDTEVLWNTYGRKYEAKSKLPLDSEKKRVILGALGVYRDDIKEDLDWKAKKKILEALGLWEE